MTQAQLPPQLSLELETLHAVAPVWLLRRPARSLSSSQAIHEGLLLHRSIRHSLPSAVSLCCGPKHQAYRQRTPRWKLDRGDMVRCILAGADDYYAPALRQLRFEQLPLVAGNCY